MLFSLSFSEDLHVFSSPPWNLSHFYLVFWGDIWHSQSYSITDTRSGLHWQELRNNLETIKNIWIQANTIFCISVSLNVASFSEIPVFWRVTHIKGLNLEEWRTAEKKHALKKCDYFTISFTFSRWCLAFSQCIAVLKKNPLVLQVPKKTSFWGFPKGEP